MMKEEAMSSRLRRVKTSACAHQHHMELFSRISYFILFSQNHYK